MEIYLNSNHCYKHAFGLRFDHSIKIFFRYTVFEFKFLIVFLDYRLVNISLLYVCFALHLSAH